MSKKAAAARRRVEPLAAKPLTVFVLSGGTGQTAGQVLRSCLAQFEGAEAHVVLRTGVRTAREAVKAVKDAAAAGAILCHTLVSPKVREAATREAEHRAVPTVDVMGPTLAMLSDQLATRPKGRAGLSYQLNREYFDRIDAVDFTLAHDDGCRLHEIDGADVVLVGVSRVGKSATSFYLAYRGVRAANIPLLAGRDPPEQLLELDRGKVVGLTMNLRRLQEIRRARIEQMRMGQVDEYLDEIHIREELRHAQQLMHRHGWRPIDVSYKAVEEVAKDVLDLLGL